MDFNVEINWITPLLLIALSLLVLFNLRKLKTLFNEATGFRGKQFVFGLILGAPFALIVGLAMAHSNYKFLSNWERQVKECVAGSKIDEPIVISVEQDGGTFVKIRNNADDKIIWCHHNYKEIVEYFS